MNFRQKLAQITEGRNRADISRRAGLPINAVSDYINKGYIPKIDTAISLAKTLEVPLDWLADDSREWPPPTKSTDISGFSDADLMHEVCRRFRELAVRLHHQLEIAERKDWTKLAEKLLAIPQPHRLPAELESAEKLAADIESLSYQILSFQPDLEAISYDDLPGTKLDPDRLMTDDLLRRRQQLFGHTPGFAQLWSDHYRRHYTPTNQPKVEESRESLIREFQDMRAMAERGEISPVKKKPQKKSE